MEFESAVKTKQNIQAPKTMIFVHGIFSSAERTSLNKLKAQAEADGYTIVYVEGTTWQQEKQINRWMMDNPNEEVYVVGHSMGGKATSNSSDTWSHRSNAKFATINSPWGSNSDNAVDIRDMEWSLAISPQFWAMLFDKGIDVDEHIEDTGYTGHGVKEDHYDWLW